jgi:hypothetical protein
MTHYINNNELLKALNDYKESLDLAKLEGKPNPKIPEYIGECIMRLVDNLAKRSNFRGYSFVDEMKSDAIENIIKYINNYNPSNEKQNPFGYFSITAWRAFVRRIATEKKELYLKYKSVEKFGSIDENELFDLDEEVLQQMPIYENLQEFIYEYEQTMEKKKEKVIEPPKGLELFMES